jgi:protein-S-isoprenylcysteine O-methyltransferase Ste14
MVDKQDHAQVRVPPPVLAFLHVLAALGLQWLVPFPADLPWQLRWLGILLASGGLALAFIAAWRFMAAGTTLDPHSPVSALVTQGPYRFSRNPIYLGFIFVVIGLPLALGTYWGIVTALLFVPLMNRMVIRHEESYLARRFGEEYTAYQSQSRRWL